MQENNNIEPQLNKASKNNPFAVPDGYFDSFPQRLQQRLQTEKKPGISFTERVWEVMRPQFALAAAIAVFAILGYFVFMTFIQTETELLSNDAIAEYIEYYHYEFDEYHMISLLEENDIHPDDDFYYEDEFYFDSPDEYLDYLYNDNVDIDLILTEF